ncbi:MAG: exo-beta-N-acetylmuramidase NamZ domain-containing protein [Chlamydiales bacterium]
MIRRIYPTIFLLLSMAISLCADVEVGLELFFKNGHHLTYKNKRVGLITNQTAVTRELKTAVDLFKESPEFKLTCLFAPEHGLHGSAYAAEKISHKSGEIPVYSLHGETRRPTDKMLKDLDLLVFDIQEVGCRSYTYASTLFYVMEEAAKRSIPVVVLDRPNPMGGVIVDGPMMKEELRSFIGYLNVPYCHGMTIGELARFFNEEYKVGCTLQVIAMEGWKRTMSFSDTGLPWIPTSPYIPESDTPFYYASTGILGMLELVNIGIGYTMPFKIVGAPWIRAQSFAKKLNEQNLAGVKFLPFYFRPFYGPYKGKDCQGVRIVITAPTQYRPLAVQSLLIGMLKTLYPKQVGTRLASLSAAKKKSFCQVCGNQEMLQLLLHDKYVAWKLITFQQQEREDFQKIREKYLLY